MSNFKIEWMGSIEDNNFVLALEANEKTSIFPLFFCEVDGEHSCKGRVLFAYQKLVIDYLYLDSISCCKQ